MRRKLKKYLENAYGRVKLKILHTKNIGTAEIFTNRNTLKIITEKLQIKPKLIQGRT